MWTFVPTSKPGTVAGESASRKHTAVEGPFDMTEIELPTSPLPMAETLPSTDESLGLGAGFGSGGGRRLADEIGVPLLGSVPLDPALREAADAGTPILEAAPDAEATAAIVALAERIQKTRRGSIRKPLTVLS